MKPSAIRNKIHITFLWIGIISSYPFLADAGEIKDAKNEDVSPDRFQWGIIPAASFDADLGFRYGAVVNIFDYGNKPDIPFYDQYLFLRFTNSTGGTMLAQALLESDRIIRRSKVYSEVSYIRDSRLDFYGFNGRNARLQENIIIGENQIDLHNDFYTKKRRMLRLRTDIQTFLGTEKLRLLMGYTFQRIVFDTDNNTQNFDYQSINWENHTLFDLYNQWNIIDNENSKGGNRHLLKAGLVYDSRNHLCYCTNGIWAESFMIFSPGNATSGAFSRHIATFRQHISMGEEKFTFSYRLSSQQKVSGNTPFYMLPWFFDSRLTQDGPGGAFSLRGAFRNRTVADGFLAGNVELKFKLPTIHFRNNEFFASITAFYDNLFITQNYPVNTNQVPERLKNQFFDNQTQTLHHTYGPGVYIVFNQNNVITVNYGFSTDRQIGAGGLYIGSGLLF